MKPIVKWPGGKSRELRRILALTPEHDLYVEPFVGGGALFFLREPETALLNDANPDLISFYRAVRDADPRFFEDLEMLARDREEIAARAARRGDRFAAAVAEAREGREAGDGLAGGRGDSALLLPAEGVAALLEKNVRSKIRRLLGLERKHDKVFTEDELPAHFETALQAGYYTAVRDLVTDGPARFFFLRQLCYGSMFRYGKDGRFNIPYGGISYNRVDFRAKVARLASPDVRGLLGRAEISCGDFADHLAAAADRLGERSFVFLDPPYDTEFSDYGNRVFDRADQERLAAVFAEIPGAALLVIQKTDFVTKLYEDLGAERRRRGLPFFLRSYGKTYGYNVRGRNVRDATHLLIGNYDASAASRK